MRPAGLGSGKAAERHCITTSLPAAAAAPHARLLHRGHRPTTPPLCPRSTPPPSPRQWPPPTPPRSAVKEITSALHTAQRWSCMLQNCHLRCKSVATSQHGMPTSNSRTVLVSMAFLSTSAALMLASGACAHPHTGTATPTTSVAGCTVGHGQGSTHLGPCTCRNFCRQGHTEDGLSVRQSKQESARGTGPPAGRSPGWIAARGRQCPSCAPAQAAGSIQDVVRSSQSFCNVCTDDCHTGQGPDIICFQQSTESCEREDPPAQRLRAGHPP